MTNLVIEKQEDAKVGIKGPGSKGGQGYYDESGQWHYGKPPEKKNKAKDPKTQCWAKYRDPKTGKFSGGFNGAVIALRECGGFSEDAAKKLAKKKFGLKPLTSQEEKIEADIAEEGSKIHITTSGKIKEKKKKKKK